ncbi:formate/nitrite transporter FocA (FNT family) [Catalinimonas alkaloidigena]|uniref:formate/nitrite transporter family protein n=1 Tax=Catalinimonas alkaloidigena TaxID=1075417 RepID=UPI0024065435|nr:formate/nitrite transporter family protein [Catalinimonas alkaloidigena]MDF9798316.1 formate/nitrite transporter FocA (FNT family) [Catalinimonas alkaloidigena]
MAHDPEVLEKQRSVAERQAALARKHINNYNGKDELENLDKLKDGGEILKEQIQMALTEYRRHNKALFFSSFSGGLEIGFSLLLMGALYTMFHGTMEKPSLEIALAFAYPIGFIFVILGRSELFTEHTNLAVLPVLNGSVRIANLLELWGIIFIGNLMGGYLFSLILAQMGPAMGVVSKESLYYFADKMVQYDWLITLGSAMFAGWLMGLLSWLVTSSKDTISRIIVIILVTTVIGIGGLHHSIVGSIEVFAGMIVDERITIVDYLHFQTFATLGNILGGTVFVAIVKYSHLGNTNLISERFRKRKTGN